MYPFLRRGNKLPTVALVQIMLNDGLPDDDKIEVDGDFGPITEGAVKTFQRSQRIPDSGQVNFQTWNALNRVRQFRVVDSVDATDPDVLDHEAFRRAGGRPIVNYGMSNGVRHVITQLTSSNAPRTVSLLRFHGHGAPGSQVISAGGQGDVTSSVFDLTFIDSLARLLSTIRPIFTPYASVEFHGCRVAAGQAGRTLLTRLAEAWQCPVSAGYNSQYGNDDASFHFEGRTRTICPGGVTLKQWSQALPDAAPVCRAG